MIVGGVILPHPPIILPSFRDQRGDEVDATIDAVRRACRFVAEELRPDRIVISSPHRGHGFDVPLWFLEEAMGRPLEVEGLLTADPAYDVYLELGRQLRKREEETPERVAVVASGDCSHRLREDGPYGFHPLGPVLDEAIVSAVRAGDPDALLRIDPVVVEEGAECGLRSFLFGLGAVQPARCQVLSYQAPYGVGYLVATLHVDGRDGDGRAAVAGPREGR